MPDNINTEILDEIIVGRVKPSIYAFKTNAVPNYLKIGDTYRPVSARLSEWRKYFPDLTEEFEASAALSDTVFFRDYAVHQYLEYRLMKPRLKSTDISADVYYSKEFFKDTSVEDVRAAIDDIRIDFEENIGSYQYYDANTKLPETYTYASTGTWQPRPNQMETIEKFKTAVENGRKNLLMYAVMRFGKSFTSMCCAKAMDAKVVLIVSAKADVKEEWKKTVESADNFNSIYKFITSDDLLRDNEIINRILKDGMRAAVFLTLQDLQGEEVKGKHKVLFEQKIDLLIVDETHYGARADSYGEILKNAKHYEQDEKEKYANEDFVEYADANETLKQLSVDVALHLSGTPYRILMGSEFEKEDIIAFYQFTDIVKDQELWDRQNILKDGVREWDNPYYGFPQMIRFAFTPSKSALALLESLKSKGTSYAFSALLKPKSLKKDTVSNNHKKFLYEKEVLELFMAIDGRETDDGLLSFLDYDKIKSGKMCQHMVIVLPYCASCDALEELLKKNAALFKNLQDYEIINISGIDSPNIYKSIQSIKSKIKTCDNDGKKTITLTVNRMLTGSTVEQWDTMIFLRDTASPQEYDQAVFRLQNQFVKEYIDKDGDVIKFNMKPQTLLVDFDPHRMFIMQEQKSMIYNVNTDVAGNSHLRDRIEEELKISPIIQVNKNKMVQVVPNDILSAISHYSNTRGVMEETREIPVDMRLLDFEEIKNEIEKQAELGSRDGLSMEAYSGDSADFDNTDDRSADDGGGVSGMSCDDSEKPVNTDNDASDDIQSMENRFRTYYSRILFFAFLTGSRVQCIDDIICCIGERENKRIAVNMGINKDVLILIKQHMNPFILSCLDYKIQNLNALSRDRTLSAVERGTIAITKFGRISESEIATPQKIAYDMISDIPDECFLTLPTGRILDVASKMGEFAIAVLNRCEELGISVDQIKNSIMSIPTSPIAYEFTRKVYEVLGLNTDMIVKNFYSYDLLDIKEKDKTGRDTERVDYNKIKNILSQHKCAAKIKLDEINAKSESEGGTMKFNAVVGNPPYQEDDGGAGASSRPIYPDFVNITRGLDFLYASLIIPTRWFTGGKHLDKFRESMLNDIHIRELHDCLHPEEIFTNTNNRGGICYLLWDSEYDNTSMEKVKIVTHNGGGKETVAFRSLKTRDLDIFIRNDNAISILNKVIPEISTPSMQQFISARKPFGIESNIIKTSDWHRTPDGLTKPVVCYGKRREVGYIENELISANIDLVDKYKVFTPRANNVGTELKDDNLNTFIGEPGTICTEAYIVIGTGLNLNESSADNLAKYFNTKFVRFMHGLAKSSHDASRSTYRFVPVMDFTKEWTDEKLYKYYDLSEDEIQLIEDSIKSMA